MLQVTVAGLRCPLAHVHHAMLVRACISAGPSPVAKGHCICTSSTGTMLHQSGV